MTQIAHKAKKEAEDLHLIKKNGDIPFLIVLKCKQCSQKLEPAALVYRKLQLDKQELICQKCNGKEFTRTDRTKTQAVLFQELIDKTKHLKQIQYNVINEVEEKMEDVFGIKQKDYMKIVNMEE